MPPAGISFTGAVDRCLGLFFLLEGLEALPPAGTELKLWLPKAYVFAKAKTPFHGGAKLKLLSYLMSVLCLSRV